MNYTDLMNLEGYFILDEIIENETYPLKITIQRETMNSQSEEVEIGKDVINDSYPIEMDNKLPVLQINFNSYVSYSVFDESFHIVEDKFKGNLIRIYEKSRYLDFVRQTTIAEQIYQDKELFHYEIVCLDHVIDIVSFDKPIITCK